jgi:uncharacterized protein
MYNVPPSLLIDPHSRTMSINKFLPLAALCILTTYGCQSTPQTEPSEPITIVQPVALDAARALERARRTADPIEASTLYVEAARLYYATGDTDAVADALLHAFVQWLPPDASFDYYWLSAELALGQGHLLDAEQALANAIATSADQHARYLLTRGRVAGLGGDHARAANALIELGELRASGMAEAHTRPDGPATALHDDIWRHVNLTPADSIARQARGAASPIARGWWSLAADLQGSFSLADQRRALDAWQRRHARHPAVIDPPRAVAQLRDGAITPQHVALLLPLTGPLASAGRAVRDGFMAGYYFTDDAMTVSVFDTNSADVAAVYEEALAAGADLVVGPLDRPSLATLNRLPQLIVPVVGLNYLAEDELPSAGLFQFSMAIEHEARAIAEQLLTDGHRRVVLFHAGDEWSHRARREFRMHFVAFGGEILEEDFFAAPTDVTPAVGRVLLVQNSQERQNELARLFGYAPEFMPRRRADIDAVVALIDASQARALQPALAYYFASEIPVYTTSQALQTLASSAWRELDGMRISQIPWRLHSHPVKTQLHRQFPSSRGDFEALYAFGLDAYRIADRIHTLIYVPEASMIGATGILRFDNTGRITRHLTFSDMRNGRLVAVPAR